LPLELYQVAEALERILRRLADAREGVVQKMVVPGYTENRQSRTSKGIPRFECYPVLNHAVIGEGLRSRHLPSNPTVP
jgi:hypothetical protein